MRKRLLKLASLLSIALAVALFAPQRAAAHDDDDPPSRVARLSYARGTVSFNPAGTDDWVSAVVNRPITTGDKLWTDNGSRAELHIGSAAIRLSGNTGFSFLNLDDRMAQIRITEGTLNVRVRRLENDETFEIDTPNLAFSILRPGNYKIDVNEAGDTTFVVVRDGQGEVTGGGSAYTIHSREAGTFAGVDQLDADIQRFGNDDDDFDRWCRDRDRREDHSQSSRYVSSDVIGYEDLDEYGGWRPVPEYGTVWFPHTTIVGWAPYRYGHWVWISPWGWTWVDDAPWGFAPFHYGRWVTVGGVWGWVPCPPRREIDVEYVRPVYAPALVAWVGGPHFSIGIGIGGGGGGGVAWFPLGPREVYQPSYHVSRTYVTNVNVSNTTVNNTVVNNYYNNVIVNKNVTNITYVNQAAPNGVTATSQQNFSSAQPVGRNMIKVDRREVESAHVSATTPTVAPQQRSVLGADATVSARSQARFQERSVVAKTPPPPAPVSFVKQQQEIQANGGRPPAVSEMRRARMEDAQQPRSNIRIAPPAQPDAPRNVQANRPVDNAPNNPSNGRNNTGNARNEDNRPSSVNNAPANQPGNSGNAPGNSGNAPGNSGNAPANGRNNPGNMQNNPGNGQGNPRYVRNEDNRPPSANNGQANPPNQPSNRPPNQPSNQPGNSGNAPGNAGNAPGNSGNAPGNPGNPRVYNDRPPTSRPNNSNRPDDVNPQLDQRHQQQMEQLRQKQDQERQKVEQKQIKEQQKIQQNNPDDARRQRVDQNQPLQRQQVEQKPQQEQQRPQQEQQKIQQNNADDVRRQRVEQNQPPQRPQVEQKPSQEQQRAVQQNADQQRQQQRQQQVDQRQQQQLQQLEQKHGQEQQRLQQRQDQESQKAKPGDKPTKEKDKPRDDKQPHRG